MPPRRQNPNIKDVTARLRTNQNVTIVGPHPRRVSPTPTRSARSTGPVGRFRVVITAYNRPEDLTFLLRDLWGASAESAATVCIYDDASVVNMDKPRSLASSLGYTWIVEPSHVGKRGFADRLCGIIRDVSKSMTSDEILVVLQDDHRVCSTFFQSLATQHHGLDVIMPAQDKRMSSPQWTGFSPVVEGNAIQTQWMDGTFVCSHRVAEIIGASAPRVTDERWATDPNLSSGFGSHISTVLHRRGFGMFSCVQSLALHTGVDSLMHPAERKLHPLHTINFIEGEKVASRLLAKERIICGLAAIPGRAATLDRVLRSLSPQVDEINVYLNGWSREVSMVAHETDIRVVRSQQAAGDLGDAGKFYGTLERAGCVVLSCDDDIVYPRGYALRMARAAMQNAPAVITAYGSVLPRSFSSYFKDRTVYSYKSGTTWRRIHVPGTGVSAFCSDALTLNLKRDFPTKFMSDIHLAVAAKKAGVPVYLISSPRKWLADIPPVQGRPTLFDRFISNDSAQTRALQRVGPWRL